MPAVGRAICARIAGSLGWECGAMSSPARRRSYVRSGEHRGLPAWPARFTVIEIDTGECHGSFDSEAEVAACLVFARLGRDQVEIALRHLGDDPLRRLGVTRPRRSRPGPDPRSRRGQRAPLPVRARCFAPRRSDPHRPFLPSGHPDCRASRPCDPRGRRLFGGHRGSRQAGVRGRRGEGEQGRG